MVLVSFVTLDGLPFVLIEEKPIVEPLTTLHPKYWKGHSMTPVSICGAWES